MLAGRFDVGFRWQSKAGRPLIAAHDPWRNLSVGLASNTSGNENDEAREHERTRWYSQNERVNIRACRWDPARVTPEVCILQSDISLDDARYDAACNKQGTGNPDRLRPSLHSTN